MLIDTHVHLDDEKYLGQVDEIVASFPEVGLKCAINVGCDRASSERSVAFSEKYPALYATVGIHPHEAEGATQDDYLWFQKAAQKEKVVAVGEIGLDYHYDLSPRDVQKKVFVEQLELAHGLRLPEVIHTREATEDTLKILKENQRFLQYGGVIHCFSGSKESALEYLELGFHIAFGGAVTFKNAKKEDVVRAVPAERLLLETDCPYQTPVPFRGKVNLPQFVRLVKDKIQEWTDFDVESVTTENAVRLFGLN